MAVVPCRGCAIWVRVQYPQGESFKAASLAQVANVIPPVVID